MEPKDFLLMTEAQIMGYGESDTSGCWIKLQLTEEDLAKVRGKKGIACELTLREQNPMTGELKDSSHPKPENEIGQNKGGNLCRDAVMMCKNENFKSYVGVSDNKIVTEDEAKNYILKLCLISSRKEIDHSVDAKKKFMQICRDYARYTAGS